MEYSDSHVRPVSVYEDRFALFTMHKIKVSGRVWACRMQWRDYNILVRRHEGKMHLGGLGGC
jgi:hypothetical protein